jgi:hypothetical protein
MINMNVKEIKIKLNFILFHFLILVKDFRTSTTTLSNMDKFS